MHAGHEVVSKPRGKPPAERREQGRERRWRVEQSSRPQLDRDVLLRTACSFWQRASPNGQPPGTLPSAIADLHTVLYTARSAVLSSLTTMPVRAL